MRRHRSVDPLRLWWMTLAIGAWTIAAAMTACAPSARLSDAGAIGDATKEPDGAPDVVDGGSDALPPPDEASADQGIADAAPDVSSAPSNHRPSGAACTQPRPPGNATCNHDGGTSCASDQDCTGGLNGRCVCDLLPTGDANICSYDQCASDTDCADGGGVCVCRENAINDWGTQNVCLSGGNCHVDSECPSGYCSPSPLPADCKGRWYGYFCHMPNDECVNDSDCTGSNAFCAFDRGQGRWVCSNSMCGPDA